MPLKTGVDAERYRKTMRQYFNRVTLPRYFADWGTDTPEGQIAADNMAFWAASEGYQLKSHILLSPSYLPSRVTALQNDPEAFRHEIESAMEDSLKRTAKLPMYAWDALSELRESKIVSDTLGESYYASIFNRGNDSQPNAKWYINESDVLELTSEQNANIDLYELMIRKVLDDGGKISGIGFQGHFSDSVTPIPKVLAILDRFAKFGIPLEITEFDINTRDEAGQAEYTRDFLTAVFSHPATEGFTCWGFWEGSMWRPSAAMIRKDWSTKPNGKVWTDLIKKQWWTNEEGITDNNGQVIIRAFHGRHSIEIESDTDFFSKDILVDKGTADLSISLPGA
jgi:endo-1,4-beta-xylanase